MGGPGREGKDFSLSRHKDVADLERMTGLFLSPKTGCFALVNWPMWANQAENRNNYKERMHQSWNLTKIFPEFLIQQGFLECFLSVHETVSELSTPSCSLQVYCKVPSELGLIVIPRSS